MGESITDRKFYLQDPDAASATGSEKKDPEKGEEEKPTKKCEIKIINEFEYMDSQKKVKTSLNANY